MMHHASAIALTVEVEDGILDQLSDGWFT